MRPEVYLHNFPSGVKRLNATVEFIIIGQSRHEKDLGCCLMRILARCVEVLRSFDFPKNERDSAQTRHSAQAVRSIPLTESRTTLELLHRDIQQQTASQVFLMDRGKPR